MLWETLVANAPGLANAAGGLLGGSRTSTTITNSQSISVNPAIINSFGQGPVTATPQGGSYSAPSGSSSAAGNDGSGLPSYLPGPTYQRGNPPLYGDPSLIGQPIGSPIPAAGDGGMLPLILGGGALLLFLMNENG